MRTSRPLLQALFAAILFSGAAQAAPRPLLPAQSRIEFAIKQMGVTVSGRFKQFEVQLDFDAAKPAATRALVTVQIASIDSGDDDTDQTALNSDWLDKARFPQARFTLSALKPLGADRYEASGTLTLRDRSRSILVPLTLREQKDGTLLAEGSFNLLRSDFGIGGGEWNEGNLVAKEVTVQFHLLLGAAR
ncbi:Polyisoprenoid-binding protein YceI [Solimonas aquatica]|uniref:Polyisoprenoid-binding protein YceI n=1 Tax=Solimonas aquatica TaxID=489703 RepID=A0A1H9KR73_9GAMM|nr:YceI family protein [Solimonas aquatica]SER01612.1 Polyisoprenoid-binding protein YceI [Solimonas aquatica]